MNTIATVVRTNIDSPKIDCAGVDTGAKMLVGFAACPAGPPNVNDGAPRTTLLSHLIREPRLMRSDLLTQIDHCHAKLRDASSLGVHIGFQKRAQQAGLFRGA